MLGMHVGNGLEAVIGVFGKSLVVPTIYTVAGKHDIHMVDSYVECSDGLACANAKWK